MKKIFDLYGFKFDDLNKAKEKVEKALNIQLKYFEGLHRGEYYLWRNLPHQEEISIVRNFDEEDQEVMDEQYPEICLFVNVDYFINADDIRDQLTQSIPEIVFLEREEV